MSRCLQWINWPSVRFVNSVRLSSCATTLGGGSGHSYGLSLNMLRATVSTSWMRSMAVASGRRHCNTSAKQSKTSKKKQNPAEFVKRRSIYGKDMHDLRVSFASEMAESGRRMRQTREVDRESLEGSAEARAARKREKSISRQAAHVARLEAVQEVKRERTEYKRRNWEETRKQVMDGRIAIADLLAEHASEWIREDTIDEHVERVVDEFFVVAAPQRRELMDTRNMDDPSK